MKFFNVSSVEECEKIIVNNLNSEIAFKSKKVDLLSALGKVISKDIISNDYLPNYDRSTVDGYAVIAQDVYCASPSIPSFLKVVADIKIGEQPDVVLSKGQAAKITTGAVMPKGATGVVMVENVEILKDEIAVYSPIKTNENTIKKGEEVSPQNIVAKRGEKVTPFLIGVLAGLGISEVEIFDSINIAIISSGDELVDITEKAEDGKIRDINTLLLGSIALKSDINVVSTLRVKDDKDALINALKLSVAIADVVFLSGGSSIGQKDFSTEILASLGTVLVHGIAQKPGKPTLLANIDGKLVFGLPGNPFAAAVNFKELFIDLIGKLRGETVCTYYAKVGENFPSSPGRLTIQPVRIERDGNYSIAYPIFLKSAHLATILKADGYVKIPVNAEGINIGEVVEVYSFI